MSTAMNIETTKRAMEVLREALEVAPEDRRAFVDRRCAEEVELLAEVESLLALEEKTEEYIEEPLIPRSSADGLPSDRRIGHYQLLERLAEGGMGVVYLAERADEEFEQRVAIKLVRGSFPSKEFVRRFRYERQILAQLEHPNIARLLDGGTTEQGVPYFVMEHVEGETVDLYCAKNDLGLVRRLRLFLEICSAVELAHRNLVVHRDLKPANVLVTDDGVVKLLDFGIARLLESDEDDTPRTQQVLGGPLLTPEYASPEQLRGEPVTTASDVYSLGVLLYELLTGRKPFQIGSALDPAKLEERQIGPTRPSRVEGCDQPSVVAFRSRLTGDLDAIIAKAMRYEVAERYLSVGQLVDDVERYLSNRPVAARRGSWLYQVGKYLRRHRGKVAVAGLALILLTSLVSNLEQRYRLARDQARAAVMSDLVNDLLYLTDPRLDDQASTPREILERGAAKAEERLAGQPADLAIVLALMGRAFRHLDEIGRARELQERAVGLVRQHLDDGHPQLAFVLNELAAVLLDEREYEEAETAAREALTIVEAQQEPDQELRGALYNNLAISFSRRDELKQAAAHHRRALEIKRDLAAGQDDDGVARSLSNLGWTLERLGQDQEAQQHQEAALHMRERLFDRPHPDLGVSYNNLGVFHCSRGDVATGKSMLERGLAVRREVHRDDPDHRRVARSLRNLGVCYQIEGDLDRAAELLAEALESQLRSSGGAPSVEVARTRREIASLLLARGDARAAESEIRQAQELFQALYGDRGHWRIADAESVLGAALSALGETETAWSLLRDSVDSLKVSRPGSRLLREAQERLAAVEEVKVASSP